MTVEMYIDRHQLTYLFIFLDGTMLVFYSLIHYIRSKEQLQLSLAAETKGQQKHSDFMHKPPGISSPWFSWVGNVELQTQIKSEQFKQIELIDCLQ